METVAELINVALKCTERDNEEIIQKLDSLIDPVKRGRTSSINCPSGFPMISTCLAEES